MKNMKNMKNNDFYFAYGSNMNMSRMIERNVLFDKMISAKLYDYELRFNKISKKQGAVANVMYNPGHIVEGILYRIKDITLLDKPEGYPKHYNRIKMNIENIDAWVYVAQPEFIREGLSPKQEYLNHLLEGKEYISSEYYQFLNEKIKT
jgi:cation transport regulator ChaC